MRVEYSRGMQYTQRKLQRSVTEMRRSCIERPSVSRSVPPRKQARGFGRTDRDDLHHHGVTPENHSRQGYSRGMNR